MVETVSVPRYNEPVPERELHKGRRGRRPDQERIDFKMKKLLALLLSLAMVFTLAACGSSDDTEQNNEGDNQSSGTSEQGGDSEGGNTAALSGTVKTGGSTSMEKVVNALIEGFNETYSDVTVSYELTGSGSGISGASDGTLDIGLASRALKDEESDVTAITIALDGIAIIVNTNNTVTDLTIEQIASIYKGEITNWSEVGGADGTIVLIGREASSGTRDGFESIVGVEDECQYAQELNATGAVISAVAANENAIGYASLASVGDTVSMIKVNGVDCTEETVKDGTYPIQRPFNFVVKDVDSLSEEAKTFLEFAQSEEAADLILAGGAVPMS